MQTSKQLLIILLISNGLVSCTKMPGFSSSPTNSTKNSVTQPNGTSSSGTQVSVTPTPSPTNTNTGTTSTVDCQNTQPRSWSVLPTRWVSYPFKSPNNLIINQYDANNWRLYFRYLKSADGGATFTSYNAALNFKVYPEPTDCAQKLDWLEYNAAMESLKLWPTQMYGNTTFYSEIYGPSFSLSRYIFADIVYTVYPVGPAYECERSGNCVSISSLSIYIPQPL